MAQREFDLDTGPNGAIIGGTWTCPNCHVTLQTTSFVVAAFHLHRCASA